MIPAKPKQTLVALAVMLGAIVLVIGCNNAADSSKATADSTSKMSTDSGSKMSADTLKKVDTTKMDTASTRPVKTT
jgi:hypothetical protein